MLVEDKDTSSTLQVMTWVTRQLARHLAWAQPSGGQLEKQRSRLNKLRTTCSRDMEATRAQLWTLQSREQLTYRTTPPRDRLPKTWCACQGYPNLHSSQGKRPGSLPPQRVLLASACASLSDAETYCPMRHAKVSSSLNCPVRAKYNAISRLSRPGATTRGGILGCRIASEPQSAVDGASA